MRVMVIVKADKSTESGAMPDQAILTAMGKYNEELVKAGIMLSGEGLHPSSKGKRARYVGGKWTFTDGPFSEAKELIAGFWIWKVKSMDEAVEWVKRCPATTTVDSQLEIRPIFEDDDFGAEFTPELRAQEERIRAQAAANSKKG